MAYSLVQKPSEKVDWVDFAEEKLEIVLLFVTDLYKPFSIFCHALETSKLAVDKQAPTQI